MMNRLIVIGGGPAGMTAALAAAGQPGVEVHLYDGNEKLGKKLFLTGKGRCNLTNACDLQDFLQAVVTNPRFMYSALYTFTNDDLMALIEENGCPLVVERGDRVFPASHKSSDILKAFSRALKKAGVKVHLHTKITDIVTADGTVKEIVTEAGEHISCRAVVLATGGRSYTSTGSTGWGYRMAGKLGHNIIPQRPSLVGVHTEEDWPRSLQGLSLRNVSLTLYRGEKKIRSELGEMLFTHFGVSGPLVLSASAYMSGATADYRLVVDLKPGLTREKLAARLQRDFADNLNRQLKNSLHELLPSKIIPVVIKYADIDPEKVINQITKEERERLVTALKALVMYPAQLEDMERAVVTAGGVSVKEIDPGTMASKLIQGLYFAGEIIDVDALTGGYNIQIATSTGWLAGLSGGECIANSH